MEAVLEEMDRQDEIIMEEDTLPTISEERNNNLWYFVLLYMCYKLLFLKGQSNDIFDLHFFQHSNRPGSVTNGLKYFRFWFW